MICFVLKSQKKPDVLYFTLTAADVSTISVKRPHDVLIYGIRYTFLCSIWERTGVFRVIKLKDEGSFCCRVLSATFQHYQVSLLKSVKGRMNREVPLYSSPDNMATPIHVLCQFANKVPWETPVDLDQPWFHQIDIIEWGEPFWASVAKRNVFTSF